MDSYRSSRLEALEALEKAATPGPWLWSDGSILMDNEYVVEVVSDDTEGLVNPTPSPADAALIAEARNLLPALIAVARAADEVRKEYELWAEDANDGEFAIWSRERFMVALSNLNPALRPLLDEGDAR